MKKGCKHNKHEMKENKAEEILEHATGKEEREHYGKEEDFFQEAIDKIMGKHKRK
jgi:hypothetical protein